MSRLRRYEDRKAQKKLAYSLFGSVALLLFLGLFGLKILVGFSLLVDKIRGTSPSTQTQNSNLLQPPVLNPLPEATYSATLTVTGKAQGGSQLVLYLNDTEYKKIQVPTEGIFEIPDIAVNEGSVSIRSKLIDEKNGVSDNSNIISTSIDRTPPKLAVSKPEDGAKIQDGTHKATVEGITDSDCKVTINTRIVVVRGDGSFAYNVSLSEGDNTIHVVATDPAGNETTSDRRVQYQN